MRLPIHSKLTSAFVASTMFAASMQYFAPRIVASTMSAVSMVRFAPLISLLDILSAQGAPPARELARLLQLYMPSAYLLQPSSILAPTEALYAFLPVLLSR